MFYKLSSDERLEIVAIIRCSISYELGDGAYVRTLSFFSHKDTYIRKAAYLSVGKIYQQVGADKKGVLEMLEQLFRHADFKVRQTVINAAGEIGKNDFEIVRHFFDTGLFDPHHSPRNAVIGSIKKMGEVNPVPVLQWARTYLHHEDKEVRREICHGIELRGRKHPSDILPLLQELEHDETARVRNTLVHVVGQIAYKKGCLPIVTAHLKNWENKTLVNDALAEIINVHGRYRKFTALTQEDAKQYIVRHFFRNNDE